MTDQQAASSLEAEPPGSIAVVGMAGRFPAASNVAQLWHLLDRECEATRWLTDDELLAASVDAATLSDPNYVRASLILPDLEMFDAEFFRFSPREAAILDPQHRHFLECAWEALEDAGHMPDRFPGAIGVFAGCGMQAYFAYNLLTNPELLDSVGLFLLRHTGNDKDFLTTRVSYLLDLQGPSVAVQTACSTSLVAIHLACQSLLTGECDMALAGGVSIEVPHGRGYRFADGEILSPDGHCRAFDDDAKGTLFGSGLGIVVLRRLKDAIESGDNIHLVIRGSAINNDGSQKAGYLAPSVDGQARAAAEALAVADVEAASVSYIEAHGTGTPVGDPIELAALSQAYGERTTGRWCGIGSIKTNIGHLDTAAGVASLIKVALSMRHERIPASLNYRRPNSRFDLANSPFHVVDRGRPWPRGEVARRAAVNSVGVGGTNAHAILEEPPERVATSATREWQLLTLSARSEQALQRLREKWLQFAADPPADFTIADAAFTLQVGRRAFDCRCALVARDVLGLRSALAHSDTRRAVTGVRVPNTPITFMFPGGGAQYPGAARGLYESIGVFRNAVESCFRVMPAEVPSDLRTLMFERSADDAEAALRLEQPVRALAALFVLEYALSELWRSWGVTPSAVIGHSAGEYAAAAVAGVMTLQDALSIVVLRGQLFERMPPGGMLAVQIPEPELRERIKGELDIAAVNAPDLCVATGAAPALEILERRLRNEGVESSRVRVNVAAHSRLLEPQLDVFRAQVEKIRLAEPRIPFVSNLFGEPVCSGQVTRAEYWVRHLRQTVRFADGMSAILNEAGTVLLEVGPGQSLSSLARLARSNHKPIEIVATCRKPQDADSDVAVALAAAARLWTCGQDLDWAELRGSGSFRRIPLPAYAFERQRHWIEPGMRQSAPATPPRAATSAISRLQNIDDWFNLPEWRPAQLAPATADRKRQCLVFSGTSPLGPTLEKRLAARGTAFRAVRRGLAFGRSADGGWVIDPARPDDYAQLFSELEGEAFQPEGIFYLWALDAARTGQSDIFEPLFHLCRAMQLRDEGTAIHLLVATAGTLSPPGGSVTHPERATLLGPCRAVATEIPHCVAQLVDIGNEETSSAGDANCLLSEFDARACDAVVTYRGRARWIQELARAKPMQPGQLPTRIAANGVYVITGGLGGIGLQLALFLATEAKARLALISRREMPPRAAWPALVASADRSEEVECLRRLLEIEAAGAEILLLRANVADAAEMRRALDRVTSSFGRINGVFHAAGVLGDAPLATKTVADTRRVMAPKVAGGAVLNTLLPPGSIDLFAVFSSTSVTLGTAGQVDYIAANAFLDALAASRRDGLAIAWGVWSDMGMAARRYRKADPIPTDRGLVHPLLGAEISRSEKEICFEAVLDPQASWVLAEHRIGERAVLPGVAYLEAAHAAMAIDRPATAIEIANLSITMPLVFEVGDERLLRTSLTAASDGFDFAVQSRALRDPDGDRGDWTEHAYARARYIEPAAVGMAALAIPAVGELGPSIERPQPAQAGLMSFGPRWHNIVVQSFGVAGGVAEIEIPDGFAGDLETFALHPALADTAASFGIATLKQQSGWGGLFVPMSVERVRIAAALPRRFRSTCHLTKQETNSFATFDVVFSDLDGNTLATLEGFSLRYIDPAAASLSVSRSGDTMSPVEQMLAAGIRAADAPELFRRLLDTPHRQVLVSSVSLLQLRRFLSLEKNVKPASRSRPAAMRSEGYASEIEKQIAGYWSELLGVETVNPADDFFALGGHSLAAVRLSTRIRKQLGVDLPLASLFEARTLREFAALVADRSNVEPTLGTGTIAASSLPMAASGGGSDARQAPGWEPLVTINRGNPARVPLFFVHGGGGNVLTYSDLCRKLGHDRPAFGLQAAGIDGRRRPLPTIEAMAASYLAAIRSVRPEGPYCVGGFSAGGVVAFEMTRRLTEAGDSVPLLFMFDSMCPLLAQRRPPLPVRMWRRRHRTIEDVLEWRRRRAHRALIRRHLARDETIPEDLREVHLFDSYMKAQACYRPAPLHTSLLLFRASQDDPGFRKERLLGWHRLVTGPIEVHMIEADHLGMMSPANIEIMHAILQKRLDEIDGQLAL